MRARIASFVLILMAGNVTLAAEGTQRHIELRSTSSVSKAAFDFSIPRKPEAVLVLSPGANGDGKSFLDDKNWTEFATRQGWAVAAVTFVSPVELLKKNAGYYDVAKESGKLLFAALGEVGLDKVPIYAFGFSGGARFRLGLQ